VEITGDDVIFLENKIFSKKSSTHLKVIGDKENFMFEFPTRSELERFLTTFSAAIAALKLESSKDAMYNTWSPKKEDKFIDAKAPEKHSPPSTPYDCPWCHYLWSLSVFEAARSEEVKLYIL